MTAASKDAQIAELQALLERERASRAELESSSEKTTRELSQALAVLEERSSQLDLARVAAEAASRAKSEFLANMSHEIRTPLNAVIGLTEVVLSGELAPTQREHLRTVMDAGEALLAVINDILDISKIEAGKLELERVEFDIHDLVGDALRPLALRAQAKGLELACMVEPELPARVVGDPGRLRQVITNLVGNAIKFTDAGEVVVRVSGAADEGEVSLDFAVRDTGIGIEPVQLERLFGSFEQIDSSTTRRFGGTGLGLSISRQLVELMGGRLGAESTPGEGSEFRFSAVFEAAAARSSLRRVVPSPLGGARVLIVDDNATNRIILEEVTRAVGLRPVAVGSAEEALAALERGQRAGAPLRLLLTDLHMPEVDGYQLIEQIRADSRFDALEIVVLSSGGEADDAARGDALRVSARLRKPVKQPELLEVLSEALGGEPRRSLGSQLREGELVPDGLAAVRVDPAHILLVEDSVPNQKVALAMLAGQGHRVVVAGNGREALERIGRESFDAVLMDVQMPEMDGLEATAAIRVSEAATGGHLPIIAMTAHVLPTDREECLAAGMDDYVAKPVRRDDLFRALARATAG